MDSMAWPSRGALIAPIPHHPRRAAEPERRLSTFPGDAGSVLVAPPNRKGGYPHFLATLVLSWSRRRTGKAAIHISWRRSVPDACNLAALCLMRPRAALRSPHRPAPHSQQAPAGE